MTNRLRYYNARALLAVLLLCSCAEILAAEATTTKAPDWVGPGYEHYAVGDVTALRPRPHLPGLALMGGGEWPLEAFRWFVARAGGGHILVLRARGGDELQQEIYNDVGGMTSVETLVIHDEDAVEDPRLLAVIARADGIFIGGGDQSNYVRLWKGTAINRLLDAHVAAGRPIGGTSAGLAVLGGYVYGCLDSISLRSEDALEDPTGSGVTLVSDFLHLPYLAHLITDTHFAARGRQGRLIAFVARLAQERDDASITGLGIDEDTAMVVDGDGIGRFYNRGTGYAWLIRPLQKPAQIVAGQPLTYRRIPIVGIGPDSTLDLKSFRVTRPAFNAMADVRHGALVITPRAALQ
ncbi:MAG: cyanophycinase [Pseudomonadota bacterium]|nr:cyanophycinase [Pseudomonadota bacterium]